jgi:hypothetical protein
MIKKDANDQMIWLDKKLNEIENDKSIIWKLSNMHYPMFALDYGDYQSIIQDYLPKLKKAGFDVYLSGHEHAMSYSRTPVGSSPSLKKQVRGEGKCWYNEMFPGGKGIRKSESKKGEYLHHFISGAGSYSLYDMCQSAFDTTGGEFKYANNKHNGFALVYATPEKMTI